MTPAANSLRNCPPVFGKGPEFGSISGIGVFCMKQIVCSGAGNLRHAGGAQFLDRIEAAEWQVRGICQFSGDDEPALPIDTAGGGALIHAGLALTAA
jgi:hypothetical protein